MNEESDKYNSFGIFSSTDFGLIKGNIKNKIVPIIKYKNVKQMCGGNSSVLVLTQSNEIHYLQSSKDYKVERGLKEENSTFIKIAHSYYNGLALTQSGLVYSIGNNNSYNQLPLKTFVNLSNSKMYLSEWFVEKNIKVRDIICTSVNNYFLSYDNVLYGNGLNTEFQLGNNQKGNIQEPVKVAENVEKCFGSPYANHNFYTNYDDQLVALGRNTSGFLGIGHNRPITKQEVIQEIKGSSVKRVSLPTGSSFVLLKTGKVLVCPAGNLAMGSKKMNFQPLHGFENKDINFIDIASGSSGTVLLTDQNEFYAHNFGSNSMVKLDSQIVPKHLDYQLSSSNTAVFIFPNKHINNDSDFAVLLKEKKFSDYELKNFNIKIHKSFVECRLNKMPIEEIEQVLNLFNDKKKINTFLEWVYSGIIGSYVVVKEVCEKLGITNFANKSFSDDLLLLYNDEDSKNFNLLVKMDEDEIDSDDLDEENIEDSFLEIPVHKYILYARSGLFREMFDQIQEKANSVTDYSGKTIESLELLVKYFYTSNIEMTADYDPVLIADELSDAVDYYQLNEYCNLPYLLKKLKK
ncbi:hypothetical protein M0812_12261 [Anaeramoeba flamelloides]|uniref:BTB domain-containing protein n=1 Tax=Anaeramoeba flamelloides TaxID=1746091 RepID=A0AAV7ZRM6_9EUKA|nr:hypothetical protein M0812_12261 [Anaeramoeba flamelloides]